jgi:hypothetical protein
MAEGKQFKGGCDGGSTSAETRNGAGPTSPTARRRRADGTSRGPAATATWDPAIRDYSAGDSP